MAQSTQKLITSIKIRAATPSSQNLFTDALIFSLVNDEVSLTILPTLLSVREDYFSAIKEEKTNSFHIPRRAIGGGLKALQLVRPSGEIVNLHRLYEVDQRSITESRMGYYIKNQTISLAQDLQPGEKVLVHYFARPSELVDTDRSAQILAINGTSLTVDSIPSVFSSGVLVDFIAQHSSWQAYHIDEPIVGVSGSTVDFTSLPAELKVGDYLAVSQESPLLQLPLEFHPIVAQFTAAKMLESMGDSKAKMAREIAKQMLENVVKMVSPRASDEPKIIPPNDNWDNW